MWKRPESVFWKRRYIGSRASCYNLVAGYPRLRASFRQAIEVARRQEAKSWELRATLSLARLLQRRARSEEARQLLSEISAGSRRGSIPRTSRRQGLIGCEMEASP